jgi:hypothetical protein
MLDYATATPTRRDRSAAMRLVAAVLGTVAVLFGILMLYYGVSGIVWLTGHWIVGDGMGGDGLDVFAGAVLNAIGALSAFFAVRWIRFAIKGPAGRREGRTWR